MMHFQKEISKRESSNAIQGMNKPVCYGILGNSALTFRARMKMHLRDKSVCFKQVGDYARSGCGSAMIKRRLVLFTSLKHNVWFIALLLLFSRIAAADTDVFLPISQGKISQEEAESILIDFFAERCNLPCESVEREYRESKAECALRFGLFGYGSIPDAANTPVWEAYFQLHGSDHYALLDSKGEILFWRSHGAEHHQNEPDVWENAVPAIPLETDATKPQILSDVKMRLIETAAYSKAEIEGFDYWIRFVYEQHFNEGQIPVWLTYVYDDDTLICKQANGYDGSFMCMGVPEADFGEYRTSLPSFGDTMGFPYSDWYGDTMTIEEKATQAEYWRPAVEQWLKDYPYSASSLGLAYDVTLRQIYGIPDDEAIAQHEAERIARGYASRLGLSENFVEQRACKANYLVTDPENPVWRILIKRPDIPLEEAQKYRGVDESVFKEYVVEIHAYTGEVVYAAVVEPDTPAYMYQY